MFVFARTAGLMKEYRLGKVVMPALQGVNICADGRQNIAIIIGETSLLALVGTTICRCSGFIVVSALVSSAYPAYRVAKLTVTDAL